MTCNGNTKVNKEHEGFSWLTRFATQLLRCLPLAKVRVIILCYDSLLAKKEKSYVMINLQKKNVCIMYDFFFHIFLV